MLTLFGSVDSGNVHKAQLILARAGVDYRRVDVAQTRNEPRDARFFEELEPLARHALGVMESRLDVHDWLADEGCTIADFALYPYTRTADSVGFDMSQFPGGRAMAGAHGVAAALRSPGTRRRGGDAFLRGVFPAMNRRSR